MYAMKLKKNSKINRIKKEPLTTRRKATIKLASSSLS